MMKWFDQRDFSSAAFTTTTTTSSTSIAVSTSQNGETHKESGKTLRDFIPMFASHYKQNVKEV